LRDNQLADGSWGSTQIVYAHGNTLSTLAAILALSDWGDPEDGPRLARAAESLFSLAEKLPGERHESVTFELLVSVLASEVRERGFRVPDNTYERYAAMAAEKRKLMREFDERKADGPPSWWVSLELLGPTPDPKYAAMLNDSILAKNGSILVSVSSTAYFLRFMRANGQDSPRAFAYLERLYREYEGGVPCLSPIDTFEVSYCVTYLLQAGIPAGQLTAGIEKVKALWTPTGMGYTSHWVSDPDETALSLWVFRKVGLPASPEVLFRYFTGTYFRTFLGERSTSVIVNVHGLLALREFLEVPAAVDVLQKTLRWMESSIAAVGAPYEDKWFFSPYYPTCRAVHSLTGMQEDLARRCVDWILATQRVDGGWSAYADSTAEETALAGLALADRHLRGHPLPKDVLLRAKAFLDRPECTRPTAPLWIHHALYCPSWVAATTVVAARYALKRACGD
jgi:hypothetical protein